MIDHLPLLAEGDLKTSTDVLVWLRRPLLLRIREQGHTVSDDAGFESITDAKWFDDYALLRDKLVRERRVALLREARKAWRKLSQKIREAIPSYAATRMLVDGMWLDKELDERTLLIKALELRAEAHKPWYPK